jgi:MFS superfamily sulfate permease-like transporter
VLVGVDLGAAGEESLAVAGELLELDPTAADALADGIAAVRAAGRVVAISRATQPITVLLERQGVLAAVGAEHLYGTNRAAEVAYRAASGRMP